MDLTGLSGNNLSVVFNGPGGRFTGTGAFSTPIVTPNADPTKTVSTFNYTPSAADVAVGRVGEFNLQFKATYLDGTTDFSTFGLLELLPLA